MAVAALPTLLASAEPSAFGAGDLNDPSPYGLTSSEQTLLETKKKLTQVSVKSNNQANELESLRERMDGLQSVIESLSRKSHNNNLALQNLKEVEDKSTKANDEYQQRLGDAVEHNAQSIDALKSELSNVMALTKKIESNYVSKDEFNALVQKMNDFKSLISKELDSPKKAANSSSSQKPLSSAQIYDRAKMNFDRKYYTDAIKDYEQLIKNNYKPAYAHYMIGEMNFRRKNYANAISYFKESSALYSKASYMPTLMLHTAISMHESGDATKAKSFFNAVIQKYPDSQEAKKAKEYL